MAVAGVLSLGVGTTPPSPPSAGFTYVWISSVDGFVYKMDSAGVVTVVGGGSFPVGWGAGTAGPGALYVDLVAGNDLTAEPYNAVKPYQTINAALADAIDGDIILLSKGVFSTAPLAFGSLTEVTIIGMGRTLTTIEDTVGSIPLINPPVGMTRFRLFGVAVHSQLSSAVVCDGAGSGGTYLSFEGRDLQLSGDGGYALNLYGCNDVYLTEIDIVTGSLAIDTCTAYRPIRGITSVTMTQMHVGWDNTSPDKPNSGRTTVYFQNLFVPNAELQLSDQVDIHCDKTCEVISVNALSFGLAATLDMAPNIQFHGVVNDVTGIAFWNGGSANIPDTTIPMTLDFSGTILKNGGRLDLAKAALINPIVNVVAQGLVTDRGAIVSARAGIRLRVSSPSAPAYQGLGIIQPDQLSIAGLFLANGAGSQVLTYGVTFVAAPKVITATINRDFGTPNISDIQISAKTTTGFTLHYTGTAVFGADVIDVTLTW